MALRVVRAQPVMASSSCRLTTCNASKSTPLQALPKHIISDVKSRMASLAPKLCSLGAAALICLTPALEAQANQKVAEFATSGLIPLPGVFRDTVQVIQLEDPGVEGVTLYYTDYSRSLAEKLSNDPFADPSQSSVTCVATGKVLVKDPESARGSDGQEIFSELKTLNFFQNKRLRVRRIYDETNGALIYISYSTRFTSSNVSSSNHKMIY